jgi:CspA family cold shock protein
MKIASKARELHGTIKWFDPDKNYGFIVPDDGTSDVLLHATCLQRGGYHGAPLDGTRVVVKAVPGKENRLQAAEILWIDKPAIIKQRAARTHVTVEPVGDFKQALVKWFNEKSGFGFVMLGDGTPDIFVHRTTLRACAISELRLLPGEIVYVRFGQGPKGLMAAEIRLDRSAA